MAGRAGDALLLLGETAGWLDRSAWAWELHGRAEGPPPPVDLEAERRAGELVRALKAQGLLRAAHDLSDGGLAVAVAEMALASGCGARIDGAPEGASPAGWFFGEDQGRYLLACAPGDAAALLEAAEGAGVPARAVGALEGAAVTLGAAPVSLEALRAAHEGGFAAMMGEA
jgi:phosphoribosylformylglycinamidine synthase